VDNQAKAGHIMDRLPPVGGLQNLKTKTEPQKLNAHKARRQVVG